MKTMYEIMVEGQAVDEKKTLSAAIKRARYFEEEGWSVKVRKVTK